MNLAEDEDSLGGAAELVCEPDALFPEADGIDFCEWTLIFDIVGAGSGVWMVVDGFTVDVVKLFSILIPTLFRSLLMNFYLILGGKSMS